METFQPEGGERRTGGEEDKEEGEGGKLGMWRYGQSHG